jgi:hypothetical protein
LSQAISSSWGFIDLRPVPVSGNLFDYRLRQARRAVAESALQEMPEHSPGENSVLKALKRATQAAGQIWK